MVARAVSEITWIAIDPGDSRLSPTHIEKVILSKAQSSNVTLNWLATNPIVEGESRFGFLLASDQDLTGLKRELLADLEGRESVHEERVIDSLLRKETGRFIRFPSDIESFEKHSHKELTTHTAIEQVIAVGEDLPEDAVIDTSGYLRPVLYEGKITLMVERLYTGEFAPIEKENPHQCCGGAHAPH